MDTDEMKLDTLVEQGAKISLRRILKARIARSSLTLELLRGWCGRDSRLLGYSY